MPAADLRIFGRAVVTMDAQRTVIRDGAVAVVGSEIAAVGDRAEIERSWTADRDIDLPDGIVIPGLVNSHTHSLQTLLRGGIGAGRELYDWLINVMYPGLAACSGRDAQVAAETFAIEAIRSGTTTIVDNADAGIDPEISAGTLAGFKRIGVRTLYCPLFIEVLPRSLRAVAAKAYERGAGVPDDVMGPLVRSEVALARTWELLREYDGDRASLIRIGVAPALPQTTSEEGLAAAAELAERADALLTIHVSQARVDRRVRGRPTFEYLRDVGVLSPRLLAAHCVWLTPGERDLLAEHNVRVAHNPTSNMFLSAGIAPTTLLKRAGVVVGLGTDDANSNNAIDLFQEMKLAVLLQRVSGADSPISAADAFAMGTIDGARAIGLDSVVGSLEPGKQADVAVVDGRAPELVPAHDLYETLVFQRASHAVDTVVVAGHLLMSNRRLVELGADEEFALLAEAQARSAEVVRRARLSR